MFMDYGFFLHCKTVNKRKKVFVFRYPTELPKTCRVSECETWGKTLNISIGVILFILEPYSNQ